MKEFCDEEEVTLIHSTLFSRFYYDDCKLLIEAPTSCIEYLKSQLRNLEPRSEEVRSVLAPCA